MQKAEKQVSASQQLERARIALLLTMQMCGHVRGGGREGRIQRVHLNRISAAVNIEQIGSATIQPWSARARQRCWDTTKLAHKRASQQTDSKTLGRRRGDTPQARARACK